jgi:hypothetical protein
MYKNINLKKYVSRGALADDMQAKCNDHRQLVAESGRQRLATYDPDMTMMSA